MEKSKPSYTNKMTDSEKTFSLIIVAILSIAIGALFLVSRGSGSAQDDHISVGRCTR